MIQQSLRSFSGSNRRLLPRSYSSSSQPTLPFTTRFGTPISQFFLYSSLTMIMLTYVWTRLTFEETRLREEESLKDLEKEVEIWRQKKEAMLKSDRSFDSAGNVVQKGRPWWLF
ncbi:hypothetical protein BC832DRAFT_556588 [Gaertneriomyces semiglobifer]|nr:hypothetical protein BC832DRAFT_556588 [Gaertneriomyces semiglobifer]